MIGLSTGLVIAACAGFMLGLRFRVPALLVATAITVVASVAADWSGNSFGQGAVAATLLLVATLQSAYLAGVAAALTWRTITRGNR